MTLAIITKSRGHPPRVPYGVNGVFGSVPTDEPINVSASVYGALTDAGLDIDPYYLRTGDATGRITITDEQTGRRAIQVNGVLAYVPTNTPFELTAGQLEAINNAGIAYTTEYDTVALAALDLDNLTVTDAAALEDPVGEVTGQTAGSTLSLTDDAGGLFALVDGVVEVADVLVADDYEIEITETFEGYTNSPRATPLTITVTAA